MLIIDPYSLLPAFTVAAFLGILLWPEDIPFKSRLRLFMAIDVVWVLASLAAMSGYGASERPFVCLINTIVGCLGLIGLIVTYFLKPSRGDDRNAE